MKYRGFLYPLLIIYDFEVDIMDYLDRVRKCYKYYSISSTTSTHSKSKTKINISGRITRGNVTFWLAFSAFFVLLQLFEDDKFSLIKTVFVVLVTVASIIATIIKSKNVYKKIRT